MVLSSVCDILSSLFVAFFKMAKCKYYSVKMNILKLGKGEVLLTLQV